MRRGREGANWHTYDSRRTIVSRLGRTRVAYLLLPSALIPSFSRIWLRAHWPAKGVGAIQVAFRASTSVDRQRCRALGFVNPLATVNGCDAQQSPPGFVVDIGNGNEAAAEWNAWNIYKHREGEIDSYVFTSHNHLMPFEKTCHRSYADEPVNSRANGMPAICATLIMLL